MSTFNERMEALGNVRSVIRDLFEYGLKRKQEIGEENVFDYSLGNPSVPAPSCVNEALEDLIATADPVQLHGYTSAAGAQDVRQAVADDLNARFQAGVSAADLYMTCGAAASLTITLNALSTPGSECVAIAPFFPEYRVFAEGAGMKFRIVKADTKAFQIDFDSLDETVNENTKALILNSPNNPTGVVLKKETLERLCGFLREREEAYGHPIFLISDEPYRELVYDGREVPFLTKLYDDTVVCYSYSKSLSLPGDRIGYVLVGPKAADRGALYAAVAGAGRSLGYVCAPT
ncbi:MAG: pyridoxal phosphate-dependent aminotransferase, partial [Lachnospiraceae bacterium]|nr:pyridoxal phosphate-dependent aminotransferase [Lachnospiraceae bacterium]